jgi:predicted metal-dependent hydrolase
MDFEVKYKVNARSKRINLKISPLGEVVATIPSRRYLSEAHNFVVSKQDWIRKSLSKMKIDTNGRIFNFGDGDKIVLFDEPVYTLRVKNATRGKFVLDEDNEELIVFCRDEDHLKQQLVKFYKLMAQSVFEERSKFYADLLGVSFNNVVIKDQSTRWGSCSSKRNLNYNFRVLLAPETVLNYLVVHEVCHLKEMNHSSRFWDLVAKLMPEYKEQQAWLKENGFLLKFFLV